ncbi:MAG TPA: aldo/keto reductase, partial [Acidimicrobiales bacterium]|nr:aldo/keto reductase [Acidimicrobiales bacterium]
MRTRTIGTLTVSEVGIGCNNFGARLDEAGTKAVVDAAVDAGITLFDTADIYGGTQSEVLLGRALGARRADVVVATKFGMPVDDERKGAAPDYVRRALEDSLRRLGTEYVDLYQLHVPDDTVPIGDTLAVLDEQVRQGKVREIGCSNFTAEQLRLAAVAAPTGAARFASVQNQFSLLYREPERDVLPECEQLGLAFLPYYPLASGLLSGKYRAGAAPPEGTRMAGYPKDRVGAWLTDANLARVGALESFAAQRGHSVLELAFAWLRSHRRVASVIAGAMNPDQVRANAAAAAWDLDEPELAELDELAPLPPPPG